MTKVIKNRMTRAAKEQRVAVSPTLVNLAAGVLIPADGTLGEITTQAGAAVAVELRVLRDESEHIYKLDLPEGLGAVENAVPVLRGDWVSLAAEGVRASGLYTPETVHRVHRVELVKQETEPAKVEVQDAGSTGKA